MNLVEHLMQSRTPLELAKELAQQAKENAALKRRIVVLQVEVFWLQSANDQEDTWNRFISRAATYLHYLQSLTAPQWAA